MLTAVDRLATRALPMLIDLSPSSAVDAGVEDAIKRCFADFGAVSVGRHNGRMRLLFPRGSFERCIEEEGVIEAMRRMRQDYDRLGDELHGKELRLRLIRAADLHVEDERLS